MAPEAEGSNPSVHPIDRSRPAFAGLFLSSGGGERTWKRCRFLTLLVFSDLQGLVWEDITLKYSWQVMDGKALPKRFRQRTITCYTEGVKGAGIWL